MDSTRLRAELGFREPIVPDEAICRTIAWERKHPPAHIDARQFDYAAEDAAVARFDSSGFPAVERAR